MFKNEKIQGAALLPCCYSLCPQTCFLQALQCRGFHFELQADSERKLVTSVAECDRPHVNLPRCAQFAAPSEACGSRNWSAVVVSARAAAGADSQIFTVTFLLHSCSYEQLFLRVDTGCADLDTGRTGKSPAHPGVLKWASDAASDATESCLHKLP